MKFNPVDLRLTVLEMAYRGQSVHIGCAFSLIEVVAVLYRSVLNLGDRSPRASGRDYLVLSKGHGVMALYACMHELGWLDDHAIKNYFAEGSELKGLSEHNVPGLEVSSGSLGHGLSVAVGLALAAKLKNESRKVFCIVGDGELNEGSMWEALLFATQFKLDNLVVIVDENKFQAMGATKEIIDLGNLKSKFEAFGLTALDVDGHDETKLLEAFQSLCSQADGKPKAVVAATIKGQGVSFMANNNDWHYTRLTQESYQRAVAELQGKKP